MNIQLQVVIPMAGLGSRFTTYGFKENKYLLPVDRHLTKMIEKAILTLCIPSQTRSSFRKTKLPAELVAEEFHPSDQIGVRFIFIIREEQDKPNIELRTFLHNLCVKHDYECVILSVFHLTEGPASTVYVAKDWIDNEIPLIVSNSDQILDWNFQLFYTTCKLYDGCVLTYTPPYDLQLGATDKHSFVRFEHGEAVEFVEKTVISHDALVGVHYYGQGSFFTRAYEYMVEHNMRAPNQEFYLSYTYQALLLMGMNNIGIHKLHDTEIFYPVGEPEDYFNYYKKFTPMCICNFDSSTAADILTQYSSLFYVMNMNMKNFVNIHNYLLFDLHKGIAFLSGDVAAPTIPTDKFEESYTLIDRTKYTRGWLVGDFEPSILRTKEMDVGWMVHEKDEIWDFHYHQTCVEINFLVSGRMKINEEFIEPGQMFVFEKNIIACPLFLEKCTVLCIKIPSAPGDKCII